jgi:hypothetical protein
MLILTYICLSIGIVLLLPVCAFVGWLIVERGEELAEMLARFTVYIVVGALALAALAAMCCGIFEDVIGSLGW